MPHIEYSRRVVPELSTVLCMTHNKAMSDTTIGMDYYDAQTRIAQSTRHSGFGSFTEYMLLKQ